LRFIAIILAVGSIIIRIPSLVGLVDATLFRRGEKGLAAFLGGIRQRYLVRRISIVEAVSLAYNRVPLFTVWDWLVGFALFSIHPAKLTAGIVAREEVHLKFRSFAVIEADGIVAFEK
jgi:hypothetical protein